MFQRSMLCVKIFSCLTLVLGFATSAPAYEVDEVTDGGTITGKIVLKGNVPPPRAFPIVNYPFGDFCRRISDGTGRVLLKEFIVNQSGGLADAVVFVQNVKKGKPFKYTKNEFITTSCMFHPYDVPESELFEARSEGVIHIHPLVIVMRNYQDVSVRNLDPIVHNGQVYQPEKGNIVLNFPIPPSSQKNGGVLQVEKGRKIVQLICGMHEYMQSWGWIVDNPYYAKTRRDGGFTIENLPPGTYKVVAWHPHLTPVEKEITVTAKGISSLDFEFNGDDVVRPLYESQAQFRLGTGYHNPYYKPENVVGCEGPYCVHDEHTHMDAHPE
ncbi:MAG TPA: carboxypeptidase-like regulatory domain-containing protein [Nitrospiria bacterium]|nr:carboxypeptidase-like regulatory domain-containing protein [Nitrospiria bacterium]